MAERPIFVDTGYFVALLNERDQLHALAFSLARAWQRHDRRAVTTDAVLIELANFFARSPLRMAAIGAVREVRKARAFEVVAITSLLLDRGTTRYAAHHDKSWSLTDCLSMEVMLDTGCRDAATPDHHFQQAGFVVLMHA
jgi:predicted nucleic acid-binding protein